MTILAPVERKLADHLLVLYRGLRLSDDLELAQAAIAAERELQQRMASNGAKTPIPYRAEPEELRRAAEQPVV